MQKVENLWETLVVPLILEQYREAENWKSCLKAVIDKLQAVEDGAFALQEYFRIPSAYSAGAITSDRLEYLASLKNVFRMEGEGDAELFERFVRSCNLRDDGTPEYVIRNASWFSGDPSPSYLEEMPATFFEYTPDGRQLSFAEVQKISPAGVLGLPGASIRQDDGTHSVLADTEGNIILMVADTNPYESGDCLLTEDLDEILTESGECITVE